MSYYFSNEEKKQILKEELQSWLNTPWRHMACKKGAGADCIGFVYGVFNNLDLMEFQIPKYNKDWHIHNPDEIMINFIRNIENIEEIKNRDFYDGDILIFKFGKVSSHIGIYLENQIFHSVTDLRVMSSPLKEDYYFKRLKHIFRFKE